MPKAEASPVVVAGVTPETCEACGASFGCGVNEGSCWCSSVSLTPADLAALRERYSSCLCPACLERAASDGTVSQQAPFVGG